ncbi:MAG: hypothetical protein HKO66_09905 [Saprospiraceae bacterium]|nr:hypothetical protein [Saprospiraceae bacterium]
MRKLKTFFISTFLFTSLVLRSQSNPLDIFKPFLGKSWVAEGTWNNGAEFKQEQIYSSTLNGTLIQVQSFGFIDKEHTKWGQRNLGTRKFEQNSKQVIFIEHDVFGGMTTGTVTADQKGNLYYDYQYGDMQMTDYWEVIDTNQYKYIVGSRTEDKWDEKFLEATFYEKNFFNTKVNNPSRYFDFWIGEWTVYVYGTENIAGHSVIEPILDSMAIKETYRTDNNQYRGTSLNKYNPTIKQWEQFWVDNSGLTLLIKGNLIDGKMILEGVTYNNGKKVENRITWSKIPDDSVRQRWEQKQEGATEWTLAFDGHYKRKN